MYVSVFLHRLYIAQSLPVRLDFWLAPSAKELCESGTLKFHIVHLDRYHVTSVTIVFAPKLWEFSGRLGAEL